MILMAGFVQRLEGKLQCNCDLDSWQRESETGHSRDCRIHKAAELEWLFQDGTPMTSKELRDLFLMRALAAATPAD